jgi:hypothetical protein
VRGGPLGSLWRRTTGRDRRRARIRVTDHTLTQTHSHTPSLTLTLAPVQRENAGETQTLYCVLRTVYDACTTEWTTNVRPTVVDVFI